MEKVRFSVIGALPANLAARYTSTAGLSLFDHVSPNLGAKNRFKNCHSDLRSDRLGPSEFFLSSMIVDSTFFKTPG
jgi:hypothetical protein